MSRLKFKLEAVANGSRARAASFETLHGPVTTPIFMPVGTQATVKSQTLDTLATTGSCVLLANTYHLLLRPGPEVFKKFGGIHNFMKWKGPVLTDSGGFQIFSLPHARSMTEEGALFKSYVDGQTILLTPEKSIETQRAIGSDIMMVLDQCVPSTCDLSLAKEAMDRTHRWAIRSLKARGDSAQSLFAIVQGACFENLRKESAQFLTQVDFDGFAIGGLAVGETKAQREDFTALSTDLLPQNLPRYLMGVGTPIDILEAVHRGVDLFDCILPTQLAQRGVVFSSEGKKQLRRSVYKFADQALDPLCACYTCRTYSKAYLHHLIKAEETLGWHLLGIHNLHFYHQLMREIRQSILTETFQQYYAEKRETLQISDCAHPPKPPKVRKKPKKSIPTRIGDYEVYTSPQGFSSVRHISSGEIMHSVNSPIEEAKSLYIEQSQLKQRILASKLSKKPIIIWDVGLGAATNAMAAIHCYEECIRDFESEPSVSNEGSRSKNHPCLKIISFETDLDSFKLALLHPDSFPHLQHEAPSQLLKQKFWRSTRYDIEWTLIHGDFLRHFQFHQTPDLIFYDPFSSKTNSELWSWECFKKLFNCIRNQDTQLFTYSASTAVRAGLLAAGFHLAFGRGTGPKSDTTIATTLMGKNSDLKYLTSTWLEKWSRSTSKFPVGVTPEDQGVFQETLFSHSQFVQQ